MHIKMHTIGGHHWLAVTFGTRLHVITRLGKAGDCVPMNGRSFNTRPYIVIDNAEPDGLRPSRRPKAGLRAITSAHGAGDRKEQP